MHVLYFHQHFTTPEGSSGTRSYEISKRLLESGHRVTMVCGAATLSKSGLSGPFSHGRREGSVDGIKVIELEVSYSNYHSFLRRTWTFLRFAFTSVLFALRLDYEVVFATSTPLTAAIPGIAASWLRRKPFVFEVRDLWPELPRAMGVIKNPVVLRMMDWLEFAAYHSARFCIALSPGIAQGIRRRGISDGRVITIPNAADLDLFCSDEEQSLPDVAGLPQDAFVAAFTGAHGLANGLGAVLDAASELRRRGRKDIRILFIGDGKEKPSLIERALREGLDNCLFWDPLPKKALAQFLCRRASVGLMILADVPAFYYGTSPNKFFDYLASALPILVNYPGWMAEMVAAENIGTAIPPNDPSSFADALMRLADHPRETAEMGARARAFAEREFLRSRLSSRCVSVMEQAAMGKSDRDAPRTFYRSCVKRFLDLLILTAMSPIVIPVMAVVALAVRTRMGSPILFRQVRPGYKSKPFTLMKFRTMNFDRDREGALLPDNKRLTKLGVLLRRFSLDELPQLWNVLKGDMTLVGPRPLLMQYLERYTTDQARRHDVKPGITGWAQVNGRNAITWEEKFVLDQWYVDHLTFTLDLKILVRTIRKTFGSQGITQPGHATAEEFWGTR
jgi:lipopolysaccharide/colanic/teichoic acid biosynthesis glycosyltransferase/glycosyltransferase involved in cell wall biosynthesis